MASIRHPLLGYTTYGPKNAMGLTGQCLHARVLGFIHPRTGEYVEFEAPLPEYFQKLLEKYFEGRNQLTIDSLLGNAMSREDMIEESYKLANREIGYRLEKLKYD